MLEAKQTFKNSNRKENRISCLGKALRLCVEQKGIDSYSNIEELSEILYKQNVDIVQIKQVELILISGTFLRYLKQLAEGISAVDINNIVQSSMSSGLSLETVKVIVSDLLYGVGIIQKLGSEYFPQRCQNLVNEDFYIHPTACGNELKKIERQVDSKEKISDDQFSYLNYCSSAGIPIAARILGNMYLFGEQVETDLRRAVEYLKYAVRAGDAKAMCLLGDYYFKNGYYNEAYELYTSPGTYAVDRQRQQRVKQLCEVRKYNDKKVVVWMVVAAIIELVMLALFKVSPVTGTHKIAQTICSLLNVGTAAWIIYLRNKKPFTDLRGYGIVFSIIIFIYFFMYIFV